MPHVCFAPRPEELRNIKMFFPFFLGFHDRFFSVTCLANFENTAPFEGWCVQCPPVFPSRALSHFLFRDENLPSLRKGLHERWCPHPPSLVLLPLFHSMGPPDHLSPSFVWTGPLVEFWNWSIIPTSLHANRIVSCLSRLWGPELARLSSLRWGGCLVRP